MSKNNYIGNLSLSTTQKENRILPQYDLFVSYSEYDRAWVEGYLLDALKYAGVRHHRESAFTLGVPRILEFERAVQESKRTLLVLSKSYIVDGFNQFTDLLAQTYGLETATWPVIPLILDSSIRLPQRLAMLTSLDASDSAHWSIALERLCAELQRPVPAPAPRADCPYPGMVPFRARDAQYFFGRDTEMEQILLHLRHQRFLLVVGPSGSGKSSLIRAGVLPRLTRNDLFPPRSWLVRAIRPGDHPLGALAQVVEGDMLQPSRSLNRLLAAHPPAQRLLLVIDQFEELFTQATPARQQRFIAVLNEMRTLEQCVTIIIMRADFYPDLMNSELWPVHAAQRIEIVPLRGKALRQAIEQPATDAGVYLEAGLLERLVGDAANEPGVLPLLQETMVLLWSAMQRRLLPIAAYEHLGSDGRNGLAVAMATKADAALASLSPMQEVLARRMFLRLVQFGEGRADTRRQQHIDALRAASDDTVQFEQTLGCLVNNRLLTLSGEITNGEPFVDIAHEALIFAWARLAEWIRERREAEQVRRRLETNAAEWVRLGRGGGGLLDKAELSEAERWLSSADAVDLGFDETLLDIVRASREAIVKVEQEREAVRRRELVQAQMLAAEQRQRADDQSRANKRLRFRFVAAAIFAALAVITAGAAIYGFQWANEQTEIAERNASTAQNLALVSAAQASLNQGNTDLGLALAVAAAQQEQPQLQTEFVLSQAAYGTSARNVLTAPAKGESTVVAFSSKRKQAVVGYSDGSVRIWDLTEGSELLTLPGDGQEVTSVAFNQDTSLILVGFVNGEALIYNLARATSARFTVSDRPLIHIGIVEVRGVIHRKVLLQHYFLDIPIDRVLFVGVKDGPALFVDIETGAVRDKFADRSVAFSAGGPYMLVRGDDSSRLALLDLKERKELASFAEPRRDITSYSVGLNGRYVIFGHSNGDVRAIEVATGKEFKRYIGHTWSIASIAIYSNAYLLTSSFENGFHPVDRTVRLWDLKSGRELRRYTGHTDDITTAVFDPEGNHVLSASQDGTLRLWDAVDGDEQERFKVADGSVQGHADELNFTIHGGGGNDTFYLGRIIDIAFSRDSRVAVTDSSSKTVRLWDMKMGKPIRDLIHTEPRALTLSADGSRVAFSLEDSGNSQNKNIDKVVVWDVNTGRELRAFVDLSTDKLILSPDGTQLIVAVAESMRRWDVNSGRELPTLTNDEHIKTLAFSPDGSKIAGGSAKGTVRIWDAASGQTVAIYSSDDDITTVAFSPDGQRILGGSFFGRLYLWDIESHQLLQRIEGHSDQIIALAFSPDGTQALSGSKDAMLRLWDLVTSQELRRFNGHLNSITGVAFSPDSKSVLSGSSDGTIRRWRIDTLAEQVAWARANRYIPELSYQQRALYQIR